MIPCPDCGGIGLLLSPPDRFGVESDRPCPRCMETGTVEETDL